MEWTQAHIDHVIRMSLTVMIAKSFNNLKNGEELRIGWLIRCMAWHLEEVLAGRSKRLIINVPPRHLKSISASVAFPAFALEEKGRTIEALVDRIDLSAGTVSMRLRLAADDPETIARSITLKRRGVERRIVIPGLGGHEARPDPLLCSLISKPLVWMNRLVSPDLPSLSAIAKAESMSVGDVSRTLQLAFLAPDIVEAILAGRQPVDLTAQKLKRLKELPAEWSAQRRLLGFNTIA